MCLLASASLSANLENRASLASGLLNGEEDKDEEEDDDDIVLIEINGRGLVSVSNLCLKFACDSLL